jgi:chromosome segregation ATPase
MRSSTAIFYLATAACSSLVMPGCVVWDIKDGIEGSNANLIEIQNGLSKIDQQLVDVNTNLTEVDARLDSMDEQLKSLQTQLDATNNHLNSLRNTISNIDKTIPFLSISGDDEEEASDETVDSQSSTNTDIKPSSK